MYLTSFSRFALIASFLILTALAAAGQYSFDTWTTDNGLPQNGVRQITQTPDGYLWFTTFDGLVRFDGVRFTTFNKSNTQGIINNRFTGIFADTDGTVYAMTREDGVLTIYRNGEFSSITSDKIPGNYISRIERHTSGELRFLTEDTNRKGKSWHRFDGSRFEFIEKEQHPSADFTFTGRNGSKWTLTATGITEERKGHSTFTSIDLSKVNLRQSTFEDSFGGLWIGDTYVYYVKDGVLQVFGESDGLPEATNYHSFWQDPDGSVWFASGESSSGGINLVQHVDGRLKFWGASDGLKASAVQNVFHDREGNTWLATTRGISRRRKNVITAYSTADGIDHPEVYPLLRDRKGNIWIGSAKGLNIYRNGKFEPVQIQAAPPADPGDPTWRKGRMSIQSLWEDPSGVMWVGLNGGIFLVKNGVAELLLQGSHVNAILGDGVGNVWAATNKGLVRFKNYRLVEQFSMTDGLPNDFMTFVFQDSKGSMWFGGYGGLSKYEGGRFRNYSKQDGLSGNYVRTIYEDNNGVLWVGTYDEGLSRFSEGNFVTYNEENGLFSNGVFAIEEDERGNFWISSNRGIYRVKRKDLNDYASGVIAKINSVGYGKSDGMLSNECNGGRQPASLRDEEGRFWFPTQDGVAVLDPRADEPNPLAPTVIVEDVLVEHQSIGAQGELTVEPGSRDIEFRYTGVSLIKSDQVKFQYMLEGHDRNWIDAGPRRSANYSYLPPGKYRFLVKASNSDGVWAPHPAALAIEKKPYFYQTYTFYVLVTIVAGLCLFAIWRLSVYHLRQREATLARLVKERTVELAQANEDLRRLANSDGLTKIGNRRRFESFLADEWHRAMRYNAEVSLALFDIDHFKAFNDTYGHQAGDEALHQVAQALAKAIKRPTDLVARFGGEEFAMVLGATGAEGAVTIAAEAFMNVRELDIAHRSSGSGELLTVSVGIATVRASFGASEIDLINAADRALYAAKRDGRDCIHVFDPVSDTSTTADAIDYELESLNR